jgi:hypothetical protein
MHSHIALYLRQIRTISCNKIKFTYIPLYFLLLQQSHEDIIKADLTSIYLLRSNDLLFADILC